MEKYQFPEIILNLPQADIPLKGLSAYLFQGEEQQIVFMEFEQDIEVPEHSHEAQWGAVLAGEIELTIEGGTNVFKKGDTYFLPAKTRHSARIKAGYKDVAFFNQKDRYHVPSKGTMSQLNLLIFLHITLLFYCFSGLANI